MAAAVILTGSRGGVIAYLFTFAVCIAGRLRGRAKSDGAGSTVPVIAGAAAFALLIVFLVVFLGGADSLLAARASITRRKIFSGRTHFWSVAWQVFLANPVFGAGMDAFGVAFTQFDTRNGFYRVEQAHNDYLQVLADGGIVGFAIVAAFIFLLLRKGIGALGETAAGSFQRVTRLGALAGCVGVLVHSFVDFPLRTASNAFFFLLVVAMLAVPAFAGRDDAVSERGR